MAKGYYDPIKRAEETARLVCNGDKRRYYRSRPARFYGGIGTADCLGCCLRCLFCWSWDKVVSPARFGQFYSPLQVAEKLTAIAGSTGFDRVRISGNEPTLGRSHLIQVLDWSGSRKTSSLSWRRTGSFSDMIKAMPVICPGSRTSLCA